MFCFALCYRRLAGTLRHTPIRAVTVVLQLDLQDGVLGLGLHASSVRLDDTALHELAERVERLPASAPVLLEVHVQPGVTRQDIPQVTRRLFATLRERAEYRLKETVRAGRLNLVVGTVVLIIALGMAELIRRMTSGGGGVAAVVEEGLTIVGWIALWRPLDLLLFERWALRRDIARYRRLEQLQTTVVAG